MKKSILGLTHKCKKVKENPLSLWERVRVRVYQRTVTKLIFHSQLQHPHPRPLPKGEGAFLRKSYIYCAALALVIATPAIAETPTFDLTIKDHKFSPEILEVPAGQKIKLVVKNGDATAEEFESSELGREKVIKGNSQGVVFVGPLKAGEYKFFGEFHEETAKGKLVAK